jgi:hypothetical protein
MRSRPDRQSVPLATGFAAFLPPDYQGGFSSEWLMGLSPFDDRTCVSCYSVQQEQWVTVGPREAEERILKCERGA